MNSILPKTFGNARGFIGNLKGMAMFSFLSKKKEDIDLDWGNVVANLSGELWMLLHENPQMLVSPYARVVLNERWGTSIQSDKRPHHGLLKDGEITYAFFRENETAFSKWANELQSPTPVFQQAATQEFAAQLVAILKQNVTISDPHPLISRKPHQ
jgi:hypothetical protein